MSSSLNFDKINGDDDVGIGHADQFNMNLITLKGQHFNKGVNGQPIVSPVSVADNISPVQSFDLSSASHNMSKARSNTNIVSP